MEGFCVIGVNIAGERRGDGNRVMAPFCVKFDLLSNRFLIGVGITAIIDVSVDLALTCEPAVTFSTKCKTL